MASFVGRKWLVQILAGDFTLTLRPDGPAIIRIPTQMPKAENSNAKDKDLSSFEGPRHRPHWLAAFTCLVFGILILVALFDFAPGQSIYDTTNPTSVNLVGVIGAEYTWCAYHILGAASWLIPAFLLRMA